MNACIFVALFRRFALRIWMHLLLSLFLFLCLLFVFVLLLFIVAASAVRR